MTSPVHYIACIGDSTVQGSTLAATNWPSRIHAKANRRLPGQVSVAQLGVGNYTISQTSTQWSTNAESKPGSQFVTKTLMIMVGINDILAGTSGATSWTALKAIIDDAGAGGWNVICCKTLPFKTSSGWTAGKQTEQDALNASIAAYAPTTFTYDAVDTYTILEDVATPDQMSYLGGTIADVVTPTFTGATATNRDYLHPNDAGHELIARAVFQAWLTQQSAALPRAKAAPLASPTFTGVATAPEFTASGLTGAVSASSYVGAVASVAPTTGTFVVGDFVIAQDGRIWICTTAGSPGTWTQAGAGSFATIAAAVGQPASGAMFSNIGHAITATFTAWAQNRLYYMPLPLAAGTLDRIGSSVNTLGAGETWRLGIYTSSGGRPGSLVLDAGTINGNTAGLQLITISQAVNTDLYWLAMVHQGGATSTALATGGNNVRTFGLECNPLLPYQQLCGWYDSGTISGALPSTAAPTTAVYAASTPIVCVRYA